jgi:hypothetical protein
MPPLDNPRDEVFAQAYVETGRAAESYRRASKRCKSNNGARVEGHRKLKDPKVLARIEELEGELATRHNITLDRVLRMLIEDRALAHEAKQASAAVSASMGIAKLCGLEIERHEIGRPGDFSDVRSIEELFARIFKVLPESEAKVLQVSLKHMLGSRGDVIEGEAVTDVQ